MNEEIKEDKDKHGNQKLKDEELNSLALYMGENSNKIKTLNLPKKSNLL